jgi:hypothetical protein
VTLQEIFVILYTSWNATYFNIQILYIILEYFNKNNKLGYIRAHYATQRVITDTTTGNGITKSSYLYQHELRLSHDQNETGLMYLVIWAEMADRVASLCLRKNITSFTTLKTVLVHRLKTTGMNPAWSGRGELYQLWCRVQLCRSYMRHLPINYCIWIVIVLHNSLIIMVLLKLLHLSLSLIFFCFIMKNTPLAPPLVRPREVHPP